MDNTNRKNIFGTQTNVGFSATAVAVGFFGHNYNCPFFHIVYLSSTSQGFVKSLYSFLCLD